MTKTFCDRCGAEIHEPKYAWLSRNLLYTKFCLIPHRAREEWDHDDKYICPQCEEEYIEWFKQSEIRHNQNKYETIIKDLNATTSSEVYDELQKIKS